MKYFIFIMAVLSGIFIFHIEFKDYSKFSKASKTSPVQVNLNGYQRGNFIESDYVKSDNIYIIEISYKKDNNIIAGTLFSDEDPNFFTGNIMAFANPDNASELFLNPKKMMSSSLKKIFIYSAVAIAALIALVLICIRLKIKHQNTI